jgi:hypothetical protein
MKRIERSLGLMAVIVVSWMPVARAQTPCQGSQGPDVIVGDITGPANYSVHNNLEALSLGTTSCNQGTVGVSWMSNNNKHPVIGGELYRFKVVAGAGRFEQVGLSWLKHGFYAESQQLCCNNCVATDGTNLGVGCSDPYTAQRNGTQSLLGPRYQVNPNNGMFTYPPPHPSGTNTGRLEVDISDLEVSSATGTRYFGNAQYVTADDAGAGHGNNNCSYREVTVAGSGSAWTFGFSGSTQREIPAIEAWQNCEAGVSVKHIQLTNEGLLILGYKTTDLGGGMFHYEYAIFNMNSDLAVGGLSIPVPSGVTVTNVGFHDVTYRGGDGVGGVDQDGTDWAPAVAAGSMSWATSTFAQNPNGNAIRWGTTYNFRFDANSAPMTGMITIGTFKDAGSVQAQGDVPGGSPPPATPYCFGDGSLATSCPCGNSGATFHGCENSETTGGALAYAAGSLSPDSLVITSSGERASAYSLFIQGDASNANGAVFGDGVLCVGGALKRIGVNHASAGIATYPQAGDLAIRAKSAALGDVIPPGGVRYYQVYYRDPDVNFCSSPTGSTFNASNGVIVTWP